MPPTEQHDSLKNLALLPQIVAIVAIVVGIFVLLGWLFNIDTFKNVLPGLTPMKANTAFGFILSGIALWNDQVGYQSPRLKIVSLGSAGLVALLGLLTLGEYLSGIDFGIDQWLIQEETYLPGDIPGRMAVNTAFSFAALGAALLLLTQGEGRQIGTIHGLALLPLIVAGSALIGYGFDIEGFLRAELDYTPMALHTAAVFVMLALGVVNARPDYPFRRIMTGSGAAGIMARRLLPSAIAFNLITGWLILLGNNSNYFNETFGLALFTTASITGLSTLILWIAGLLYEADTQRQRVEEEVRAASRYARSLLEASLDPLVTISAEGKITDVNEATVLATGIPPKQLIGSDFCEYFTEPDKARTGYQEVFAKGFVTDYPLTLRHVSGNATEVLYNASIYRNEHGDVVGVFAAARDITERKRAETELHKYQAHLEDSVKARTSELEATVKELEGFAYSISHDLRTPLRAIDGYSQLLLKQYPDKLDDEGKRLLNVIRNNTKKMSQLIDDILAFSYIGRLRMTVAEVNMEELVNTVCKNLKPGLSKRDFTLEIKPLPPCSGDQPMLRQVWENLLSNAIKFTRPKSSARIEVGGQVENGELIYYVKDNGVGFDMQYVHKLFGVFQRLHGVDEFEGTGIGLAIVKRIITRHNGRVWAEGKINEGATIYFTLPN